MKQHEFRLKSKLSGKSFAVHTRFNLLNENGKIIETLEITRDIGDFIMNSFEKRGDKHPFEIYQDEVVPGNRTVV